jgi:hypothetical protein
MPSYFTRQQDGGGGGFRKALSDLFNLLGETAHGYRMQQQHGLNWQDVLADQARKRRGDELSLRERQAQLDQVPLQEESRRLSNVTAQQGIADKLAAAIASQMQGFAEGAPEQETTTIGSGDVPSGLSTGYQVNLPSAGGVPPDFASDLPTEAVRASGYTPDALVRAGRGRASESKRAIELMRAERQRAIEEQRQGGRAALEGQRQDNRLDIETKRQQGRERIVQILEGGRNARTAAVQSGVQGRFDKSLDERASEALSRQSRADLMASARLLQAELRNTDDEEQAARIGTMLQHIQMRLATREQAPRAPGAPAAPGRTAAPVAVRSRQEVDALQDGALFVVNGRTFRKQGATAIPVQ